MISQYRRYLTVSYTNWSGADRPVELAKVAVDPLLSTYMANAARLDAAGEILFGKPISRDPQVAIEGARATVADCQDTSRSGRKKRATGEVLSVGVRRIEAIFTLRLGDDHVWRVSAAEYGDTSC